jgi:hypothetical protein
MTMRKRVQIALAVVLLVILAGVTAWRGLREQEPMCQGKPLSFWLRGYDLRPDFPDVGWSNAYRGRSDAYFPGGIRDWRTADEVVDRLGTNAIPSLLRMIRAVDDPLEARLMRPLRRHRWVRSVPAWFRNFEAACAFERLGENAKAGVPALIKIYQEHRSAESVIAAVRALGSIGPPAEEAVPCLLNAVTSTNEAICCRALSALGKIHARPGLVVPVLMRCLADPRASVRQLAALSHGNFGKDAAPAIPALLQLLNDGETLVEFFAARALEKIDPQSVPWAGVNTNGAGRGH